MPESFKGPEVLPPHILDLPGQGHHGLSEQPGASHMQLEPAGRISPAAAKHATPVALTPARCDRAPLYASSLGFLIFLLHLN